MPFWAPRLGTVGGVGMGLGLVMPSTLGLRRAAGPPLANHPTLLP